MAQKSRKSPRPQSKRTERVVWKVTDRIGMGLTCKLSSLSMGASGKGGGAGRAAVDTRRRRVWASRGMADKPPDPHLFSLFPSLRLM
eukprot:1138331-Pelagomonas_calceolata.AAC.1